MPVAIRSLDVGLEKIPVFHKQLCGLLSRASAPLWLPWTPLSVLWPETPLRQFTAIAEERESISGHPPPPLGAAADEQRIPFPHIFYFCRFPGQRLLLLPPPPLLWDCLLAGVGGHEENGRREKKTWEVSLVVSGLPFCFSVSQNERAVRTSLCVCHIPRLGVRTGWR